MKQFIVLVSALLLAACGVFEGDPSRKPPAEIAQARSTFPPVRVGDCRNYVLLDNKCTRDWYDCTSGGGSKTVCTNKWESCCTLPGSSS